MSDERWVFVVQTGEYSDRHIIGIFDDEALADACARAWSAPDRYGGRADVEAFPLNPDEEQLGAGLQPFLAKVDDDGNVVEVRRAAERPYVCAEPVWARDADHARKIVGEWVARLKAEGHWPERP